MFCLLEDFLSREASEVLVEGRLEQAGLIGNGAGLTIGLCFRDLGTY